MLRAERGAQWLALGGLAGSGLALATLALLITQRGIGRNYASYDLLAYVEAARRVLEGGPLYPQLAEGGYRLGEVSLYLYPPPVALLFVPALLVPFAVASTVWGLALTVLALVVAIGIAQHVRPSRRPLAFAMFIGAFPLQWELANGNLTLVTLTLALLAWRSTGWRAGAALAFAMGLKLLAVPVALPLFIAGRRRLLALTALVLGIALLITLPLLGTSWLDWLRLTFELAAGPPTRSYNAVPEILRHGVGRLLLVTATLATLAGLGLLVRAGRCAPALAFTAALSAAPYLSAFVFYPYAILVLPVTIWLGLGDTPRAARLAALLAWLLVELQALDPETVLPLALVGTMAAVAATCAAALTGPRGAAGSRSGPLWTPPPGDGRAGRHVPR